MGKFGEGRMTLLKMSELLEMMGKRLNTVQKGNKPDLACKIIGKLFLDEEE